MRQILRNFAALATACLAVAGPCRVTAADLVSFHFADPGEAATAWPAAEGTPSAQTRTDGLLLRAPFSADSADRHTWDHKAPLDLSRTPLLALDFTCDKPEAVRAINLYFESGDGWYAWAVPVRRPGRQRAFLAIDTLHAEGKPAGLSRITRIRLSPWRGNGDDARLVIHSLRTAEPVVAVLRGTKSLPDAAERKFGDSVTRRIQGWLEDAGLPHLVLDEEDFRADSPARVAILGYNDILPDSVHGAIKAYVQRGGRLIACYSSDPRLAGLLGFRLGEYRRLDGDGRWTGFRFQDAAGLHVPDFVGQQSSNIRPVEPARADARIVATWEDDTGAAPPAPAWGMSDTGFWMTHVLSGDDTEGKQHMLAAMVASLYPPAWRWIAELLLADAGRIDSFDGIEDATAAIRAAATQGRGTDPARVIDRLDRAAAAHARATAAAAEGEWGSVLDSSREVRAMLTQAYAGIQRPAPGEIAGIWDHSGAGWYPGDWDRTCRILRDSGLTHVFPNMLWPVQAHYPGSVLPESYTSRTHGDQVAACLRAARAHGLKVHVWKVCWNLEGVTDAKRKELAADGALQRTAGGQTLDWLNPAIPSNTDRELASILELARTYAVDGIHLDYIRYPNGDACFSPASRAAFERASGRRVASWPADVRNDGDLAVEFREWRAAVITEFVRRVRRELNAVRPGIQLSAAVFANQPDCRLSIGQDWALWLREGIVDFVVPMNYDENLQRFTSRAQVHAALPGARGRILQGIGATSGESRLLADQVVEQVLAARRTEAAGFVLFDMSPTVRDRILPILRLGVTASDGTPAAPMSPSPVIPPILYPPADAVARPPSRTPTEPAYPGTTPIAWPPPLPEPVLSMPASPPVSLPTMPPPPLPVPILTPPPTNPAPVLGLPGAPRLQ